jgi:ABC-type multidrug transport system permease subunit
MMSNEKDTIVMFLLRLSTLLFFYIPQFPMHCREYVGEIYEFEYYYHPPILFLSSFSFPFPFFILFLFFFHFTLYQLPLMGPICHFIKIYSYEILF